MSLWDECRCAGRMRTAPRMIRGAVVVDHRPPLTAGLVVGVDGLLQAFQRLAQLPEITGLLRVLDSLQGVVELLDRGILARRPGCRRRRRRGGRRSVLVRRRW